MASEKKYENKANVSPFTWVDALCQKTGDPMTEHGEAAYPAFMVTRSMSQYKDCIFLAAEINQYPSVPYRMQYDFYMHAVKKGKRFAKWGKKGTTEGEVGALMKHYRCSRVRALEYLKVLTEDQVKHIVNLEKEEDGDL